MTVPPPQKKGKEKSNMHNDWYILKQSYLGHIGLNYIVKICFFLLFVGSYQAILNCICGL